MLVCFALFCAFLILQTNKAGPGAVGYLSFPSLSLSLSLFLSFCLSLSLPLSVFFLLSSLPLSLSLSLSFFLSISQLFLVSNGGKFVKKTLIGEAYIWL